FGPGGADGPARPDFTFEHKRRVGTGSRPAMAARRQDGGKNEMPASAPQRVANARGKPRMQEDIRGGNIAPGWASVLRRSRSYSRRPVAEEAVEPCQKAWTRIALLRTSHPLHDGGKTAKPQIEIVKLSRHLDGRGMANSRLFHARTAWLRYVDLPMVL